MTVYLGVVCMRHETGHSVVYAGDDPNKATRVAWLAILQDDWEHAEVQRWEDGAHVRTVVVPLQGTQPDVKP